MTDIRSLYGAPFLFLATLVMVAGAVTYLYVHQPVQRLVVLGLGMTATWLIAGGGSALFWHGRQASWMTQPANGLQLALQYVMYWAAMLALILLPMLIIVIRRATAKG